MVSFPAVTSVIAVVRPLGGAGLFLQDKVWVTEMSRRRLLPLFALLSNMVLVYSMLLLCATAQTQDKVSPSPESLLDKMTGKWVMTGTIDKEQVTHDVEVDWILNRRYIRIHEVSREKNAEGELAYEAWIHIAWDPKNGEYVVMWLDNTATTNFAPEGVGHGKPNGDRIPFVWKSAEGGGIHNTFAYDRDRDVWSWSIDNIDENDKPSSFAKVSLERKKN